MIRLALAQPGTAVLSFDLCCAAPVLPVATGRQCSPPRRLLPRQAINASRQRTASVQIPIASDTQLRHTSRGFLLWRFAYAGPTCPPRHLHGGRHPQTFTLADIGRSEVVPPPCQSEHEPRHRDRAHPPGTHRSNFRFRFAIEMLWNFDICYFAKSGHSSK